MRLLGLIVLCFVFIGGVLGQEGVEPAATITYQEIAANDELESWFDPTLMDFYGATFSSDNARLAIWGDGFIYVYNIATQQIENIVSSIIDYPESVQLNADGTALLIPNGVYDLVANTWLRKADSFSFVNQWSQTSLSQYFFEGKIWSVKQADPLREFKDGSLAVTPDLSRILMMRHASNGEITLRVRDIVNRVDLGTYTYNDPEIFVPSYFSPDLTRVLLQSCCRVQVVDLPSAQIPLTIDLGEAPSDEMGGECSSLRFNPAWSADSSRLFYKDSVYDIASGTMLYTLPSNSTTAAWTSDGSRLITDDGVWDTNTGQMLFSLPSVHHVEWRESTQRILGWKPGEVTIWDVNGNVLLKAEHTGEDNRWCGGSDPKPPAWSADGRWLATWGLRTSFRLRVNGKAIIQTVNGDTLNLRVDPSTEAAILQKLDSETSVDLIAGPQENAGYTWWQVRLEDGREGWVVESADGIQTLHPAASDNTYEPSIRIWNLP